MRLTSPPGRENDVTDGRMTSSRAHRCRAPPRGQRGRCAGRDFRQGGRKRRGGLAAIGWRRRRKRKLRRRRRGGSRAEGGRCPPWSRGGSRSRRECAAWGAGTALPRGGAAAGPGTAGGTRAKRRPGAARACERGPALVAAPVQPPLPAGRGTGAAVSALPAAVWGRAAPGPAFCPLPSCGSRPRGPCSRIIPARGAREP